LFACLVEKALSFILTAWVQAVALRWKEAMCESSIVSLRRPQVIFLSGHRFNIHTHNMRPLRHSNLAQFIGGYGAPRLRRSGGHVHQKLSDTSVAGYCPESAARKLATFDVVNLAALCRWSICRLSRILISLHQALNPP